MARGDYRLVYVAPERFRNARFIEALKPVKISLFAVDEAHCISQWGHDFRPDYLRLREAAEALAADGKRPRIIALTATATPAVRSDIAKQLALKNPASFIAGFDRHNLMLRVEPWKSDNERITRTFQLARSSNGSGIIYAATRKAVESVSRRLEQMGLAVAGYHAGLDEAKRARIQDHFMAGDTQVIVATNAFGMGVDKADLRFVTHYNLPGSVEAYYQEVGRAGRDGLPSVCTLLFNYVDTRVHEFFIEGTYPPQPLIEQLYIHLLALKLDAIHLSTSEMSARFGIKNEMAISSALVYLEKAGHIERGQGISQGIRMIDRAPVEELCVDWNDIARREAAERRKLREMVDYADHKRCLRQFILRYFGDRKLVANCRCSNCQPNLKWGEVVKAERAQARAASGEDQSTPPSVGPRALSDEEHLAARKILSCVARLEGQFGKGTVASVLRGSKAKNVLANGLDQLSTYGLLAEHAQDELTRFINALIVAGCVKQGGGAYPVVSLTPLGREVMLDRQRVELDLDAVEADTSDDPAVELPPNFSPTREQTWELYRQGLTPREIAAQRNLKLKTIEEHLAVLIEEGREINVDDLVEAPDRALIEAAAKRCGLAGLRPIKDELPERIEYSAIRIVVAALRRKQKA